MQDKSILRITVGEKVYYYDALNEKIDSFSYVDDLTSYLINNNMRSFENFKKDNEIYENLVSKFHRSIVRRLENDRDSIERTMRMSFNGLKDILKTASYAPFFCMTPLFAEHISGAYKDFYRNINRCLEVIERDKIEAIKFIDSKICSLVDSIDFLRKDDDAEKFVYETMAKLKKDGIKTNPEDVEFLVHYIEKKRPKKQSENQSQ